MKGYAIFLILILVFVFAGCKKSDQDTGPVDNEETNVITESATDTEQEPVSEPSAPTNNTFSATAKRGSAVIDGIAEDVWNTTGIMDIAVFAEGTGPTGTGRALWDDNNLYVFVEVFDTKLSKVNTNEWEQDSVEVFIDEKNDRSSMYMEDDVQYRVNYENAFSYKGTPADIVSATNVTEKGYTVEMKIPFRFITPEQGISIGFDLQINDDNGNGFRTSITKWNDKTNDTYMDTTWFGTLVLGQ